MWKWLRSWFAWRFSLGRLVIATLFLGGVVGLNMREVGPRTSADYAGALGWERYYEYAHYGWGWPLEASGVPAVKTNRQRSPKRTDRSRPDDPPRRGSSPPDRGSGGGGGAGLMGVSRRGTGKRGRADRLTYRLKRGGL